MGVDCALAGSSTVQSYLPRIGIERAQVRIERGRGEDQAACGRDGSAKIM